jgi:hypothetical protein
LFHSDYQIVVEVMKELDKAKHENQINRLTRATYSETTTPCDLSYDALLGYERAMQLGHHCYIAAELPTRDFSSGQPFQVGDNKTYGGYYNAPLVKGLEYEMWLGLKIQVDGETVAAYTKTDVRVVRKY